MREWIKAIGLVCCAIGIGLMLSGNPQRVQENQFSKASGYYTVAATGMFKKTGVGFFALGVVMLSASFLIGRNGSSR